MTFKVPAAYADNTAYAIGAQVVYNGIQFEATSAIANSNTTNPIDDDGANWKFNGMIEMQDMYGVAEAVKFSANTDDDRIDNSVFFYMQTAAQKLNSLLLPPAQKIPRRFTVSDGSIELPGDIIDIDSIRLVSSSGGGGVFVDRGKLEIKLTKDRYNYELLLQQYSNGANSSFYGNTNTDGPIAYITDGRLYVAPKFDDGSIIEVDYYQAPANLGETQLVVDSDYNPINDSDMTLAEWVAAGNSADTFVQDTVLITTNVWTAQAPELLRLGTLVAMEADLGDAEKSAIFKEAFREQLQFTREKFQRFWANQPTFQTQDTAYPG